jgi:hypothetical protein
MTTEEHSQTETETITQQLQTRRRRNEIRTAARRKFVTMAILSMREVMIPPPPSQSTSSGGTVVATRIPQHANPSPKPDRPMPKPSIKHEESEEMRVVVRRTTSTAKPAPANRPPTRATCYH